MSRLSKLFVIMTLTLIWCTVSVASNIPRYKMRAPLQIADSRNQTGTPASAGSRGTPLRAGAATISSGYEMGRTYYDYQHNGSLGRMVDEANGVVQVAWMKGTTPSLSLRTVNWNSIPITGSPQPFMLDNGTMISRLPMGTPNSPTGVPFSSADRPGYTNYRNRPGGKAVVQYHDFPETGGIQYWQAELDITAGAGVYNATPSTSPNPTGPEYVANSAVWPRQAFSECGGELIHHSCGTWSGASNEVWYWRGIVNDGAANITWDESQPTFIDSVDVFITNVIEANGDTVVIAMLKQLNPTNTDLTYYQSIDCGITWSPRINVTNYTDASPEGANVELDALFDADGELHIVFNTLPSDGGTSSTSLYHWSPSIGLRLITAANWTNTCGGGTITDIGANNGAGTNNLTIADVSITVKPANEGPGAGIPDELIYAIWTQFGPTDTDCATVDDEGTLGGHVNGEIYCSVSSNNGLTWDRPTNVTGTVTPDCVPGDCYSESWVTAAARADSGIYISYVDDRHAGAIVFGGGAWSESPFSVMALETRVPVLEPVIAVTPTQFIELNADPGGAAETVDLNIISVGNADLSFTVTVMSDNSGGAHMQVNGGVSYSSSIAAGGTPEVITITYDCSGLGDPEEIAWRLEVTSNDPQNDPGQGGNAIDVNLQVFSASTWYTCVDDTLSTGTHRMQVSSCFEMGDVGTTGLGFYDYATTAEWMYSGSPVVTRVAGPDTVAYHNSFMSPADRTRTQNKSFRAQSPFNIVRDSSVTVGDSTYLADVAFGTASTTDSTIGIDYEIVFPKKPGLNSGAYWKFSMSTLTGSSITGVSYGVVADIDVDDPAGLGGNAGDNAGVVDEDQGWVGGVSGESDTLGNFSPYSTYMALFHLPADGACDRAGALAGQVIANPNYVHPENSYNTDSLYTLLNTFGTLGSWGSNIHIDTGQQFDDISVLLVSGFNQDLNVGSPIEWGYGIAVSDVSTEDLTDNINALRAAANADCQVACVIAVAGDVNVSGAITSADIIYMVGYVFKGGNAPLPCAANGDVNCSGASTSADIIYLVGHVFKGGDPPCDICNESPEVCVQ